MWEAILKESWFHFRLHSQANTNHTIFLKARVLIFGPHMYANQSFPLTNLPGPLVVRHEVAHLGMSSYTWRCQVSDSRHTQPLVQEDRVNVMVDWTTSQKVAMPQILPADVHDKISAAPRPILTEVKTPPEGTPLFTTEQEVYSEHIDTNDHTNHHSYLKFVLKCLTMARNAGVFGEECAWKGLFAKRLCLLFRGESRLGDTLTVDTWRDAMSDSAYVAITKDGADILFAEFNFYRDGDVNNISSNL